KVCGTFGSADREYEQYGTATEMLYDMLEEQGATMISDKVIVDLEPDDSEIERCRQLGDTAMDMISGKDVIYQHSPSGDFPWESVFSLIPNCFIGLFYNVSNASSMGVLPETSSKERLNVFFSFNAETMVAATSSRGISALSTSGAAVIFPLPASFVNK